jgi:HEPN domain-containing protein
MRADIESWVYKAEGDFRSAQRELRVRKAPNLDGACFHAQQCAEKYLKARLIDANQEAPRTHDLVLLLDLLLPLEPLWEAFREDLSTLSNYAVTIRYPDNIADRAMALDAMRKLRPFRRAAREALGLPPGLMVSKPGHALTTANPDPASPSP